MTLLRARGGGGGGKPSRKRGRETRRVDRERAAGGYRRRRRRGINGKCHTKSSSLLSPPPFPLIRPLRGRRRVEGGREEKKECRVDGGERIFAKNNFRSLPPSLSGEILSVVGNGGKSRRPARLPAIPGSPRRGEEKKRP